MSSVTGRLKICSDDASRSLRRYIAFRPGYDDAIGSSLHSSLRRPRDVRTEQSKHRDTGKPSTAVFGATEVA